MREPVQQQGLWLRQVVKGWFNCHAAPTNFRAPGAFRHHVMALWRRSLRRRSQADRTAWESADALAREWLPKRRILHPWPEQRLAVKQPSGSRMP